MNIAIILAGGTGTRMGTDIPKQYLQVNDRPIISYCVETISKCNRIDKIVIVAADEWKKFIENSVLRYDVCKKFAGFSNPGENRQLSIFNALSDIEKDNQDKECYVVIHDAARPYLTTENLSQYIEAAEGHDGVLPVLPMKDTVYRSVDGKSITGLVNRSEVFAGQAPEVFAFTKYLEANKKLLTYENGKISKESLIYEISGSTQPAIMAGMDVIMVPGNERNTKITTMEDFNACLEALSGK